VTPEEIRGVLLTILRGIAPEIDPASVPPAADLRDALDIDSMDFLRFVLGIHERLGVEIPEADYARVRTLAGCAAYVAERVPR
jgi:acyl carrier protein